VQRYPPLGAFGEAQNREMRQAIAVEIDLVYRDRCFVVVDKPSGVIVHRGSRTTPRI